jgi:CubicO group peptidase (beta-lactamase class C family)
MPDGDGVSTAEDMFKFEQALGKEKLLNAEYTQKILTVLPFPGTNNHQNAFGLDVCGSDIQVNPPIYGICKAPYMVGKSGLAPGESTYLSYFPEGKYTVIILSNYTQGRSNITGEVYSLIKARTE